ncbi:hypothetical protein D9611_007391 [Ephemerocybe angulata]|uniref:G domain-containing protein n=1 Tax=Ephemerocybe angulata TaxID=980116 RepID=A0A8H5FKP4_9AGAR|nr:hypothetical protein D9611_007391 [Tulosesus angulatus]
MVEHTIVVLGRIDAGKTTFIKAVQHAVDADIPGPPATEIPTLGIKEYSITLPDGRSLTFLDTPGFDGYQPGERAKETEEILQMLEEHLASNGQSTPVSHVILFLNANDMATTELKGRARRAFERLFSNAQVVCVTTRWDQIDEDDGPHITAEDAQNKEEDLYASAKSSGSLLEYLHDVRRNPAGEVLRFRSGLTSEAYSSPRDVMLKLFAGPGSDGTLEERLATVTKERDELAAKYDLLLQKQQTPTTANDAAPPQDTFRIPRTRRQRLLDTIEKFSAQVTEMIEELEREALDVADECAADRATYEAASAAMKEAEGRLGKRTERMKVADEERACLNRERDTLREQEQSLTKQLDEFGTKAALGVLPSVKERLSLRLKQTQTSLEDMEGWISTAENYYQDGRQEVEQAAVETEKWKHIKQEKEGDLNGWLSLESERLLKDQESIRELQAALFPSLDAMREGLKDIWGGNLRDNPVFREGLDGYTIKPEIAEHPEVWAPVIEAFYETQVALSLTQKMAKFHLEVVQRLKVREDMVEPEWKKAVEHIFLHEELPPPPPPLTGHSSYVYAVAFSWDGMRIVSGSGDNTVRIWDALTGKVQTVLGGHSGTVRSVAFSPDGKHIVSGSRDKSVRVWDVLTGRVERVLAGHTGYVWSVDFSVDGSQVVSGSGDKTVRIWDPSSGQVLRILEGHTNSVYSVAFIGKGSRIVSGSADKTVRVWDTLTTVHTVLKGDSDVWSVAASEGGLRIVTGSYDGMVRVWDVMTGRVLRVLEGHRNCVRSVALSRDVGLWIVSGSYDKTLRVWDASTGAVGSVREEHSNVINTVAFSRDGRRIASGSDDMTVRVWDVASLTSAPHVT